MGIVERVPRNRPPMYWRMRFSAPPVKPGRGPSRLAPEEPPLPLATHSVLPSRLTRTLVGYQPVGRNPSVLLAPIFATLKTATSLVLAFVTNRMDSSGVSASELGVLPGGHRGSMAVLIVSTVLPLLV